MTRSLPHCARRYLPRPPPRKLSPKKLLRTKQLPTELPRTKQPPIRPRVMRRGARRLEVPVRQVALAGAARGLEMAGVDLVGVMAEEAPTPGVATTTDKG